MTVWLKRALFTVRSITSPHASDHMTLVWFRTFPSANGINDRASTNASDANRYAKCEITANMNSRKVYLFTSFV